MTDDRIEYESRLADLTCEIGGPGSGKIRYAAAMYFYALQDMPADVLEIYRRCCNDDQEDPVDLLKFEGLSTEAIQHLVVRR